MIRAILPGFLVAIYFSLPAQTNAAEIPIPPEATEAAVKLLKRFTVVVPKEMEEKLNLNETQKKDLKKIQKELDTKTLKLMLQVSGNVAGLQDAIEKVRDGGDSAPLTDAAINLGIHTLEFIKNHRESDAKFRAILTEEQLKILNPAKKGKSK